MQIAGREMTRGFQLRSKGPTFQHVGEPHPIQHTLPSSLTRNDLCLTMMPENATLKGA